MGPDELEPSPTRLRAAGHPTAAQPRVGSAAANTSIRCVCHLIRPDGIEPSSGPYKEPALTVELQAYVSWRSMGPEGFEPPPCEFFHSTHNGSTGIISRFHYRAPIRCQIGKARCAAVTPRPQIWSRYPFQSLSISHCVFLQ